MDGDIFHGHILDSFFNFVGVLTDQGIQLLGMPTEAIHTPHRYRISLKGMHAKHFL